MLKAFAPLVLVMLAGFSFFFLDGWPLSSSPDEVVEETAEVGAGTPRIIIPDDEPNDPAENAPTGRVLLRSDVSVPSKAIAPTPEETIASISSRAVTMTDEQALVAAKLQKLRPGGGNAYRTALSGAVLNQALTRSFREGLLLELRKVNRATVFGPGTVAGITTEKVVGGDSLVRIARRVKKVHKNNTTAALIQKLNGMTSTMIRPGQVLRVPKGKVSIEVHVSEFRLFMLLDGQIILDYRIGTGRNDSTPLASYTIRGKTKRPAWTMPNGQVVKYGDPRHIIGSRWLGFDQVGGGRSGYGIHGTVDEASIGRQSSEGCIRMRRTDIEALFELIPEGCSVVVKS
jgi:lipoprotein-anchoring transpeptidase ErfK/SrfK